MKKARDLNDRIKIEYAEFNKLTKREIRKDIRKSKYDYAKSVMEHTKSIKKIKKDLRQGKEWLQQLTGVNGQKTGSRPKVLKIAIDFYKKLYMRDENEDRERNMMQLKTEETVEVPPILESEVYIAIKDLKNGKCPGKDEISNELLKLSLNKLTQPLSKTFNNIIETLDIPDDWTISEIILLHKKGPKDNIGNYRPISLMSSLYKVFTKVILNRIKNISTSRASRFQSGIFYNGPFVCCEPNNRKI